MATKLLALFMTLSIVGILVVAGNTKATPNTTATPTRHATQIASLPASPTEEITEEATAAATSEALVGDPARGQAIFENGLDGAPPCKTCHNRSASGRSGFAIGPGLKDIHERAATRVDGLTAPEYIENSIRHPGDFVVGGFSPIMPTIFGEQYSDQDIADLVAYLITV